MGLRTRKGFTLIELLVVIAIIALLMSILMPALQRVKKQAHAVTCMSHLKQWGLIFAMYTDEGDNMRRFCMNRHSGFLNCLFLDFSVRKVGLKELWSLRWHREWTEDLAATGLPAWPEWMQRFKDY